MTGLITGVLFIPFVGLFASELTCLEGASIKCYGGLHIFFILLAVVFGLLFCMFAFCVQASFYDEHPLSSSPLCRAHARVDVFFAMWKAVLTVCFVVIKDSDGGNAVLIALSNLCALTVLYG